MQMITHNCIRKFDTNPYLKYPAFEDLKEESIFKMHRFYCYCKMEYGY